jgi:hypothetical protein
VAVTGPGTLWPEQGTVALGNIPDGSSNTLLLVEIADSDIDWLEPRDISLDEAVKQPGDLTNVPQLGRHHSRGSYFLHREYVAGHVGVADGSAHVLGSPLSRDDLRALASINGGETIDWYQIGNASKISGIRIVRWDHVIGLAMFFISYFWLVQRLVTDSRMTKDVNVVDNPQ